MVENPESKRHHAHGLHIRPLTPHTALMLMPVPERRYRVYYRRLQRWQPELERVAVRLRDAALSESSVKPMRKRLKVVYAALSCAVGGTEAAYSRFTGNERDMFDQRDWTADVVAIHLLVAAREHTSVAEIAASILADRRSSDRRGAARDRRMAPWTERSARHAALASVVVDGGADSSVVSANAEQALSAYCDLLLARWTMFEASTEHRDSALVQVESETRRLLAAVETFRQQADSLLKEERSIAAPLSVEPTTPPMQIRTLAGEHDKLLPEGSRVPQPSNLEPACSRQLIKDDAGPAAIKTALDTRIRCMRLPELQQLVTNLRLRREAACSIAEHNTVDELLRLAEYRLFELRSGRSAGS